VLVKGLHRSGAAGNRGTWNSRVPSGIRLAMANPEIALSQLDAYESGLAAGAGQGAFRRFVDMMWPVLEPERPLVSGWVLDVLCEHYEAITAGHIRKLLINVPPGCMKSILTALWTAWEWGPQKKPHLRYICASYAEGLSLRDNERCRDVVKSPEFQAAWGKHCSIDPGKDAKGKFVTTQRGWRFATSVNGIGTGERGDRVIFDDPHNIKKVESRRDRDSVIQYFAEVLPTRVNDPETAAFVVIMQRTHEGDVSGHILGMELGYEHLCLPMEYESNHPYPSRTSVHFVDPRREDGELLWPERFSRRHLEEDLKPALRSISGDYAVAGQLQQRPVPRGGGMFKRSWWRFYETSLAGRRIRPTGCVADPPVSLPERFDRVVVSVDAAFKAVEKGSRVSILVVGTSGPNRYVLENITDLMEVDETIDALAKFDRDGKTLVGGVMARWPGAAVIVEDRANGPAIVRTLSLRVPGVVAVQPEGGKEARANAMEPAVKSGHFFLPDGADWVIDFVDELGSFPAAVHNDQVDALSQAHIWLTGKSSLHRARMLGKT
jgi:predicted phage terminase large subunit-like protein